MKQVNKERWYSDLRSFKFASSVAAAHTSSIFRSSRRSLPSFSSIPPVLVRGCSPLLSTKPRVSITRLFSSSGSGSEILDRGFRFLMESFLWIGKIVIPLLLALHPLRVSSIPLHLLCSNTLFFKD
ncbi:hypothetical protein PIB30_026133 [Stylosanthes scabra]|uniref:Uncharacterized protein n=1 Tax=Stylosanthes scabra TaxID=79078 RepID=A0ABU6UAK0_9FABA|nr:hypothetical protein [Stylosanthes scabra]